MTECLQDERGGRTGIIGQTELRFIAMWIGSAIECVSSTLPAKFIAAEGQNQGKTRVLSLSAARRAKAHSPPGPCFPCSKQPEKLDYNLGQSDQFQRRQSICSLCGPLRPLAAETHRPPPTIFSCLIYHMDSRLRTEHTVYCDAMLWQGILI